MSRIVWAVAVTSMLVLAACGGADDDAQPGPSAAQPETTSVATPAPTNTPSQSSTPTLTATPIPTAIPPPVVAAAPCDNPGVTTVHSDEPEAGELVWSFSAGEDLWAAGPIVSDGIVYFGSGGDSYSGEIKPRGRGDRTCGTFFALSAADGRELWRFPVQVDTEAPLADDGFVFFGDREGTLRAIEAASGVERWRFETVGRIASTPAVDADSVYFVSGAELYALEKRTGVERWRATIGDEESSTYGLWRTHPLVVGGTVYVGSADDGNLYAFDARTGAEQWRFATEYRGIFTSPAFSVGLAFTGASDGYLYAVDAGTGDERWRVRMTQGGSLGGPSDMIVAEGVVYVESQYGFIALDARTGSVIWRTEEDFATSADPTLAGDVLYFGGHQGENRIHALDARTGIELWRLETTDFVISPLVVVDGVIYFATFDNSVHAVAAE